MTGGCTGFDRAGDRQGRSGRPAWPRATPDRVAGERNEGVQVARKPTWSKLDLDGASLRALRPPAMADYGCMVQEGVGGEQGRNALPSKLAFLKTSGGGLAGRVEGRMPLLG